ncbi:hypothetical protein TNCV_3714561 [Trichonephila clavipes]|nr:hypothetical protein TNCV_3714561 [Trichonephila clavipes]
MRTWRNLGGRAKLVSFLATKLVAVNLATGDHFGVIGDLVGEFGTLWNLLKVDLLTSVTFNDTSGYISGSFCRAYKKDARRYGEES